MLTLQQILDHVSTATTSDLHQILSAVQNELPKREGKSANYVEFIEDFCSDTDLLNNVWTECESLELGTKANKVSTQWLSCSNEPYVYNDSNPVHKAKDIKEFPHIHKLLGLVNNSTEVTGPLDSCLILKYSSNKASLRPHADDEPFIDQDKSICAFSIGCERTIEFWEKSRKPKLVKKCRMKNNSMVIMRPGTQQRLEHSVRSEPGQQPPDTPQVRYSLSFRAVSKPVDVPVQEPALQPKLGKASNIKPEEKKRVCLIVGDSFAARMDVVKLGKGKVIVENIAEVGAKIDKVKKQITEYGAAHPGNEVLKVIISVGTNDIRNAQQGIDHLRGPFKDLCNTVNDIYPNSRIYFQSLLPLPLRHDNDWETNTRVMQFNRIIYNECTFRHFYFIDAFFPFCKFNRRYNQPYSRFDRLFDVGGIHPNPQLGLGVLARMYIRVIHSKYFNPYIFQ